MTPKSKTSKRSLEQYREVLEQRREELVSAVRDYGQSVSDNGLRGAAGDVADHASSDYTAELFGALLEKQAGTLEEVDRALAKFRKGEYGVCESCGETILAKRLKAIPWARFCRECQERHDRTNALRRNAVNDAVWPDDE